MAACIRGSSHRARSSLCSISPSDTSAPPRVPAGMSHTWSGLGLGLGLAVGLGLGLG